MLGTYQPSFVIASHISKLDFDKQATLFVKQISAPCNTDPTIPNMYEQVDKQTTCCFDVRTDCMCFGKVFVALGFHLWGRLELGAELSCLPRPARRRAAPSPFPTPSPRPRHPPAAPAPLRWLQGGINILYRVFGEIIQLC